MLAEFAAVKAALGSLGVDVHDTEALPVYPKTALTFPYVVLWGSNGTASAESLAGASDLSDRLGVTVVAGAAAGVRDLTQDVRAVLDGGEWSITGRHVETHLWDSRAIQVDTDVTIPGTNTHPAYGVDIYTLTSVPA